MDKQYLEHRSGKAGHIEKWITRFDEVEQQAIEELSQETMVKVKEMFGIMPNVLSQPALKYLVRRIKTKLPMFGSKIRLDWYYEYEGRALTLDYYFRVVGELKEEPLYVGLAHDLALLIAVASKVSRGHSFTAEDAMKLFEAGVRSEEYFTYKQRNRIEHLEIKKWEARSEVADKKQKVILIANVVSDENPKLNVSALLELTAEKFALSEGGSLLSTKTIRKYLNETLLIDKHRDARGKCAKK
ncbi:hypothetical protein [Vibrio parahaemolyticus]|uniref:hypothetical protein n=1 Tax=Vibrio parahaemolyticus TaxID=670 RepID=UPI001122452F|nr:hypothetical protein [Vibrio parahaemolyticus]TOQ68395.1 hypothetical protein CGG89_20545 [Vibrio parahaemolyticus]